MGFETGKHFAKPDPRNFQGKLLAKYENKLNHLLREHVKNSLRTLRHGYAQMPQICR